MYTGLDRRKYSRLSRPFMVRYWIPESTEQADLSQVKDISLGGVCLTTYRVFEKGTKLVLEIKLPGAEIMPTGRVLESKQSAISLPICKTRLEFLDMEETDRQILDEKLDFFLKDKRKL